LADDLTRIGADMLDRMGGVAQDVARVIGGDDDHDGGSPHEHIDAELVAGEKIVSEFTIWNTGALQLKGLTFASTDLLHSADRLIDAGAVSFEPPEVKAIPPRSSETIAVTIATDEGTAPGVYRGLVVAQPGDAYVVITVTVGAPPDAAKAPA
jgi:hypothetical protein